MIAHVDHGKTTLVDALLRQTNVFRDSAQADEAGERVMDSEDQERERGITILAKNLAVMRDGVKINIMDTPGHADFGGEVSRCLIVVSVFHVNLLLWHVFISFCCLTSDNFLNFILQVERVLNMCDGVLLVVDSVEGPKPQTRFVLDKALSQGLKVVVVVNKIDRPAARPDYVVDKVFDLMMDLGASDEQIDFTTVFASGLNGVSGMDPDDMQEDMQPLFDAIKDCVNAPSVKSTEPNDLQCLVSNIDYDNFKGKMGIALITAGTIKSGQPIALARPGVPNKTGRLSSLFVFDNLGKREVEAASAGEIIMFSGLDNVEIGDTLITNEGGGANAAEPLPPIAVELPTVRMTIGVNRSPMAGREGKFLTSRMIRDRLFKEMDRNVALKVEETDSADKYAVSGRGQLHLTVLIETMRREGFELEVGPPAVIFKENEETGEIEEPFEKVEVRVPEDYSGSVIDLFNTRNGELQDMGLDDGGDAMSIIQYLIPTRGMLGLRSELLTATRGTAIIDAVFDSYRPRLKVDIQAREKGSLLAFEDGVITSFGLENAQDRGKLFVKATEETYKNMM